MILLCDIARKWATMFLKYLEQYYLSRVTLTFFVLICCVLVTSCGQRHGNISLEYGVFILHEALEVGLLENTSFNSNAGHPSEATITVCREAIQQDPDNAFLYCDLGNALYKLERYEEAGAAGVEAAIKDQDLPEAYLLSYLAYYKLHYLLEAIRMLKTYIDLAPPITIESKHGTNRVGHQPFSQYSNIDQARTEIGTCYMNLGIGLIWFALPLLLGFGALITNIIRRLLGYTPNITENTPPDVARKLYKLHFQDTTLVPIFVLANPLIAALIGLISPHPVTAFVTGGWVPLWMAVTLIIGFVLDYTTQGTATRLRKQYGLDKDKPLQEPVY